MRGSSIKLIVGLGNPGAKYDGTRHNIGFEVIDKFAESMKKKLDENQSCRSIVQKFRFASKNILLQKPLTYMNLSGEAVKGLMRQHKIQPEEILVVYDCLDLPVGRVRIRMAGSSGGQKGMGSIIEMLGTEKINRLRVGIASLNGEREDTSDFVLSPFTAEERGVMNRTLEVTVEAVKTAILRGVETAMNRFNNTCIEPETLANSDSE